MKTSKDSTFSDLETDLMMQSTFRLGEIQRQAQVIKELKAVLVASRRIWTGISLEARAWERQREAVLTEVKSAPETIPQHGEKE